ncbi:MAG: S8 family serine peptidase [Planctomycetes bacterium]|nr:S8 family serine peptidase [Planctomycetota bacterium]
MTRKFMTLAAAAIIGGTSALAADLAIDQLSYSDAQRELVNAIESNPKLVYNPVSIIVQWADDASQEARQLSLAAVQGTPIQQWDIVPGAQLVRVGMEPSLAVDLLNSGVVPGIEYAELDWIVGIDTTPNDPYYTTLWGMNNTGQTVNGDPGIAGADINAPEAWDTYTGDPNFAVAVIDTGIQLNHPDLQANIWFNPGEVAGNGVDDDGDGYIDDVNGWDFYSNDSNPSDENSHGSHCSGTIGGVGNNGVGVVGVVWRCKLAALRFLGPSGSGSTSGAISAVNYCRTKGIKVSNNSWGGGGYSSTLFNAINNAASIGHVFVAAAGNAGANIDSSPSYPASYTCANLISVAATNNNDGIASFSNYGATSVDVGAPGVNIRSCVLTSSYAYYNGTSMATPHVTGLAVMLYGRNPSWTYSQIKAQIMNTARPISALAGRCVTGGVINAQAAIGGSGGNTAPIVSISSPANGGSYNQGTTLTFTGSAFDNQDGTISSSLVWTSNVQGQIGTGASFVFAGLVSGTHVITASATDSGGLAGSASITISILGVPNAPSGCTATKVSNGFARVNWLDNSNNETSFEIQRQQRVNGLWANTMVVGSVGANTTSYLEFVTAGQRYRYRVRALNAAGASAYSSWSPAVTF